MNLNNIDFPNEIIDAINNEEIMKKGMGLRILVRMKFNSYGIWI